MNSTCFHCIDSNLLSGSRWWIHVSTPVNKWRQNFSLSLVYKSRSFWRKAMCLCWSCSLRFWGTQQKDIFDIWRCLWIMFSKLLAAICNSFTIYDTFTLRFAIISFSTAATDVRFTVSEGRPDRKSSSRDWRPCLNSLNHLVIVQ